MSVRLQKSLVRNIFENWALQFILRNDGHFSLRYDQTSLLNTCNVQKQPWLAAISESLPCENLKSLLK